MDGDIVASFLEFAGEFLDSSSSSSSEEEDLLAEIGDSDPEPIPKIQNFVVDVVNNYSNEQFRSNFRMDWATFHQIENMFIASHYSKKQGRGGSQVTAPRIQLLAFLWFACNKSCLRDVSGRFNMAISTLHRVISNVTAFLVDIGKDTIKFPNSFADKQNLAEEFEQISGFPGIIGCIDGTYIPIRTPAHKIKSTYINRHDQPSITLQGICDANKKFLDVFTGVSSKIHDSRVFQLSFISNDINRICDDHFHILGDAAYPVRKYLMTPFKDYGNLTEPQKLYNLKLSQSRVKIENAFGLLKQRFGQLLRIDFHDVQTSAKFIIACCVLHNICIDVNDTWSEDEEDAVEDVVNGFEEGENNERTAGQTKRDGICELLWDNVHH